MLVEQSDNDRKRLLVALRGASPPASRCRRPWPSGPEPFRSSIPRWFGLASIGHLPRVMQRLAVYFWKSEPSCFTTRDLVYLSGGRAGRVRGGDRWYADLGRTADGPGISGSPPDAAFAHARAGPQWFVATWGVWIALTLALAGLAFVFAMRNKAFCSRVHAWRLRLPFFGNFERCQHGTLASTLAILVGSGVPLLVAMAAAGVMTSRIQRAAAVDAAGRVREGMGLSRALDGTRQFPPILIHLTHSGERTGRLDRMLDRAAQVVRELSRRIRRLPACLVQPSCLLMGGVVLFIVLAILLPVFEINQFVR